MSVVAVPKKARAVPPKLMVTAEVLVTGGAVKLPAAVPSINRTAALLNSTEGLVWLPVALPPSGTV